MGLLKINGGVRVFGLLIFLFVVNFSLENSDFIVYKCIFGVLEASGDFKWRLSGFFFISMRLKSIVVWLFWFRKLFVLGFVGLMEKVSDFVL